MQSILTALSDSPGLLAKECAWQKHREEPQVRAWLTKVMLTDSADESLHCLPWRNLRA